MKIKEVPLYDFQPGYLETHFTEATLRREYKRLETLAKKRIAAIERSKFKDHSYYQRFKPLLGKERMKPENLAKAVVELKKFEYSPLLSVKKLYETRRKTIARLHEEGYTFINSKNYQSFAEFMEYATEKVKDRLWDSERIVKFYYEHRKVSNKELKKEFDQWQQNQK